MGKELTIANVYAPSGASTQFYLKFFELLDKHRSSHMILGGDFNMVAHPTLDRSNPSPISKTFPKTITRRLKELQLTDTWRCLNMGSKQYTFYLHPHNSSARLNDIFCSQVILANSLSAEMYPCVWSDHHMVIFDTKYIGFPPIFFHMETQ